MIIQSPGGTAPALFLDILHQPHTLIAGATGSGKSVLIHGITTTIIHVTPYGLVLIDPKRVELHQYRRVPHCVRYASDPDDMTRSLSDLCAEMDRRYIYLQRIGATFYDPRQQIYCIIDEFADLLTGPAKRINTPYLARLAQLGRAAGIHLIAATQRPTRDIIAGQIAVNMDCRVALRVPTAQDSRNLIHAAGAERLPRYGKAYYLTPECYPAALIDIPYTSAEERRAAVDMWNVRPVRGVWHPKTV